MAYTKYLSTAASNTSPPPNGAPEELATGKKLADKRHKGRPCRGIIHGFIAASAIAKTIDLTTHLEEICDSLP